MKKCELKTIAEAIILYYFFKTPVDTDMPVFTRAGSSHWIGSNLWKQLWLVCHKCPNLGYRIFDLSEPCYRFKQLWQSSQSCFHRFESILSVTYLALFNFGALFNGTKFFPSCTVLNLPYPLVNLTQFERVTSLQCGMNQFYQNSANTWTLATFILQKD